MKELSHKWREYYNRTRNRKPAPLLVEAVSLAKKGVALDLGAGALPDSKYISKKGFRVIAIDNSDFFIDEVTKDESAELETQEGEQDPLFQQALQIVRESKRASISLVQRRLRIGYNRAARLMEDHKEELGISYYSISQPALEDVFLDVLSRNRDLEDE